MRKLAAAQFVEDLSRFSLAVRIVFLGLQRAQNLQRSARECRVDQHILQQNEQAIAAERSDEPWQSASRYEDHVARSPRGPTGRRHVFPRLAQKHVEFFLACLDL